MNAELRHVEAGSYGSSDGALRAGTRVHPLSPRTAWGLLDSIRRYGLAGQALSYARLKGR